MQHLSSTQEPTTDRTIFTVSELNRKTKLLLEGSFAGVWVEGELSSVKKHSSGHWYFILKDERAQIRCVMFKGQNRLVPFVAEDGMQVQLRATCSLYPARGDFQLLVQHMEIAGEGVLQQKFEQLKKKLRKEGLFEAQRKQKLPSFPKHIGVISSASGAVIEDICTVLKRRCPLITITLLSSAVQGAQAAEQIIHKLQIAESSFHFDALILARGGGSAEDLQPFNEESVARAIAQCTIPIVSSVGHETDFTIADFVADYRAPTPSAAAEVLSPDQKHWIKQIHTLNNRLVELIHLKIGEWRTQINYLQKQLQSPESQLREQIQRLDYCTHRLHQAINNLFVQKRNQLQHLNNQLLRYSPEPLLSNYAIKIEHLKQRTDLAIKEILRQKKQTLQAFYQQLDAVSPLATLARGYSVAKNDDGQVISSYLQVKPKEHIKVTLHEGSIECTVDKTSR